MTRSKQYHSKTVILSIQQVDKKNEGMSSQAGEKDATQKLFEPTVKGQVDELKIENIDTLLGITLTQDGSIVSPKSKVMKSLLLLLGH